MFLPDLTGIGTDGIEMMLHHAAAAAVLVVLIPRRLPQLAKCHARMRQSDDNPMATQ